jgi:hypothetical protein
MDEASSFQCAVPAVPGNGKDAVEIVPLHLPHPMLLRAAVPITKRSEALARAASEHECNPASEGNLAAIERPARHQHGTVLGGIKTKPLVKRWPLKKRPVLIPPARAALLSLGRDEKRPFQPNKKLPKKERTGEVFPCFSRGFPRRNVVKFAVGQIVLDGRWPNREALETYPHQQSHREHLCDRSSPHHADERLPVT